MTGAAVRWVEPPPVSVPPALQAVVRGPFFLSEALARRGVTDPAQLETFLNPHVYRQAPPGDLPDLHIAVERIQRALRRAETIGIWGDFDVDGQTATTLLVQALQELGGTVKYYIPVRGRETHGLALATLQPFLDQGVSLLLTCDTGITAHEAVNYANSRGIDVIITDHHILPADMPVALAVVNPQRLPPEHPLQPLCGVGTAYKLVEELLTAAGKADFTARLLDLVALGTIADLASLRGDNRCLVQLGLRTMRSAPRPSIQALLDLSGINYAQLTEEHISFTLAPRLNAVGRLADANRVVPFLLSASLGEVRPQAAELENLNAQRKLRCDQVFKAVQDLLEREPARLAHPVLLVGHKDWPGGILGIVAGRLADLYHRPSILYSAPPGELARGSARSIEGIHITQAIASAGHLVSGYGGHPMAAGFAIEPELLPEFQRVLDQAVQAQAGPAAQAIDLQIDAYLPLESLALDLVEHIDQLAPFGPGNPPFVLASRDLTLQSQVTFGKSSDHLQLIVADSSGTSRKVLWWQGAGAPLPEGRFDLAYTVRAVNFRGQSSIQIEWLNARPVPENAPLELNSTVLSIQDQRGALETQAVQPYLGQPETLVFAEGDAQLRQTCSDRYSLSPCKTLVIWTAPPGRLELTAILAASHPQEVVWYGYDTVAYQPAAFLSHLARLVNFRLAHRQGRVLAAELASATAQRDSAIRRGIAWLCGEGHYSIVDEDALGWILSAGGEHNQAVSDKMKREVSYLLAETAAFRAFCRQGDLSSLIRRS